MLEWSKDKDFWVRRIAIDHQLCRKEKTNTKLLEAILVNNFGSNDILLIRQSVGAYEIIRKQILNWLMSLLKNTGKGGQIILDWWMG